jgi:hypothetical protein
MDRLLVRYLMLLNPWRALLLLRLAIASFTRGTLLYIALLL